MIGAREIHAEIDYFPLVNLFPRSDKNYISGSESFNGDSLTTTDTLSLDEKQFETLKRKIFKAHGIILASPVYFGDRSSVANKLLQLSGIHNLIENKIFGAASVGAKRNGGQETAIVYGLFEAINQNALVVGNGPPTSQYGGTAVGGKKGDVIRDLWGLETSYGTGRRVAHVSKLLIEGSKGRLERPVRVLVLITMDDKKQVLFSFFKDYLKRAKSQFPNVQFILENVLDSNIYRCLGCDTCPAGDRLPVGQTPTKERHAHCVIANPDDSMNRIHELLIDSDGIVIAGLNVKQHDQLVYRYQALTERTRYIRRGNFELTNKVVIAFSMNQIEARINPLHSLKTVTSYIRHNTIIHKPIEAYMSEENILYEGMKDLIHFLQYTEKIAKGKNEVEPLSNEYVTKGIGGY
jgi:multimeric flavodoxin WrbA